MNRTSINAIRLILVFLFMAMSLPSPALMAQTAPADPDNDNTVAKQSFLPFITADNAEDAGLVSSANAQCIQFPFGEGPEEVCVSGFFPTDPITVRLDQSFPLPTVEIQNNTDRAMSFTFEWAGLTRGWGPRHIHQVQLEPQTSTSVPGLVLEAHNLLEIGSNTVALGWSASGGSYVTTVQQDFELFALPPQELQDLVQVPVRWCVLEGTSQAEGQPAGSLVAGSKLLSLTRLVNNRNWTPQAHIAFRPVMAANAAGETGIPVIPDPDFDGLSAVGDVYVGFLSLEPEAVALACERAWAEFAPDKTGIVIVNAGDFHGSFAEGVTPSIPKALQVESRVPGTGLRGDDLCGEPRNLQVADVTSQLWTLVVDQGLYNIGRRYDGDPYGVLAHELGHTLMLGHGNGLDDNGDGLEPPTPGPRRYDQTCDPLWLQEPNNIKVAEDEEFGDTSTCAASGLMDTTCAAQIDNTDEPLALRPLQVEMARAVAKLVPGAVDFEEIPNPAGTLVSPLRGCTAPCDLPADIFIVKAEMAQTPRTQTSTFSHKLLGALPADANNQYLTFADLDQNSATGCAPSDLGFPTSFQGAELVTQVSVGSLVDGVQQATPAVWQCQSGSLVPVSDPGIQATAFSQIEFAHGGEVDFSTVLLSMPDTVRGPVATQVRIQALAQRLSDGQLDRLPSAPDQGGLISLLPAPLAQCTLTHPMVNPGGVTTVTASSLLPNQAVEILLGGRLIASGLTDSNGHLQQNLSVPSTTLEGVHLIEATVQGAIDSAACGVLVSGPPLAPGTAAELLPAPNQHGWVNSDVTVLLTAVDVPSGPGIKEIAFSASGAQSIPSTTVPGNTASLLITAEGETTVTFFVTDNAGSSSPAESISMRLDKMPPTITGSRTPDANLAGWNNSDVTVTFTCTDLLSGLLACSDATVLSTEGAGQRVTGTASDFAFNTASTTVGDIQIDKTAPGIMVTGVEDGAVYVLGSVPAAGCDTQDTLSGVATPAALSVSGGTANGVGFFTATCDGAVDVAGNTGSAQATYQVIYPFSGFFAPVDNPPTLNQVRAGQGVPLKFSLDGDFGLDVLLPDPPLSQAIACDSGVPVSEVEETSSAGNSGLHYDSASDQYIYIWKTDKAWGNSCREFLLALDDGVQHPARFQFK